VRPKENVVKILKDIDLLQLSQNEEIFEKASRMFVAKWKEEQDEFIKYFQNEWLVLNRNWFEGIQKMIPSTNNALEAFNRVIKDENTLRERLPISRFSITRAVRRKMSLG
jgi:transposase-like protein